MKTGDRVIVKRAYRVRGGFTRSGGWAWEDRTGTVTYATKKNVWVKLDTPQWTDIVEQFPIDRVRMAEK